MPIQHMAEHKYTPNPPSVGGYLYKLKPSRTGSNQQTGQFKPNIRVEIVTRVHKTTSQRPAAR